MRKNFPDDVINRGPAPIRSRSSLAQPLRVESFTLVILLLAPIVYLSVRHGIHACLFLLVLLASCNLLENSAPYREATTDPWVIRLLFAFSGLLLATLITQALNRSLYLPSFDGPSKIFLAALVFLFLRTRAISFARVLEFALPIGLLAVYLVILSYPDTSAQWDGPFATGRFATRFVDPNSLGSQSLILTMLCIFSIGLFGREKPWLLLLKLTGIAVGIYIALNAQSRGSWLAIPPLLILWLILCFSRTHISRPVQIVVPAAIFLGAIAVMALGYENSTILSSRGNFAFDNLVDWQQGKNLDSPIGIRLSIWKIGLALVQESPWIGFGENGFKSLLLNHPLNIPANRSAIDTLNFAGAHSDILAKLLSMGAIGLIAYLATMLIPWLYFWTQRGHSHADTRAAAHLGLYFITGVFVCGLTNEMLSLKYLCSFFGLMIAGLAADVARRVK